MRPLAHALGLLTLMALCAWGGYAHRDRQAFDPWEPCPLTTLGTVHVATIQTMNSRTCVYHPPVYGRSQHRIEMKRRKDHA